MAQWLSGDSSIFKMEQESKAIKIQVINPPEKAASTSRSYYIDTVYIPHTYVNRDNYNVILEQLLTNDLQHVGYTYQKRTSVVKSDFKTLYKTQVRGTLSIFLKVLNDEA